MTNEYTPSPAPSILGVFQSKAHKFSKHPRPSIVLLQGLGIEGDAHCGIKVQHLWDAKKDPDRPNLRQVHLLQGELLDEVNAKGFHINAGDLGENVTTRGIDLLGLPTGARLHLGTEAVVEVTGLRNPCFQFDKFRNGLVEAVVVRRKGAPLVRRVGVMSIVIKGGSVSPNDAIVVHLPDGEHRPLQVV